MNEERKIIANEISNHDVEEEFSIIEITEKMLLDTRLKLENQNALSVPVAQLSLLGTSVSSLVPNLRTITSTVDGQGLFRIANQNAGDMLKLAKDGTSWGAMKTAGGQSKMAKLARVDTLTTNTVMPINPATMMMAVALYSIEKQLDTIVALQKDILSFLEVEKQSEIEADVETLTSIINKYKHNWDNDKFVSSNHKLVIDIQRTARKNMISYQTRVTEALESKKKIIFQANVQTKLNEFLKQYKYYRLSLYSYSLASLVEVMLSENFSQENIETHINEITKLSSDYRELFTKGSAYLEKMTVDSLDNNMLKGVGTAGKALGKFIEGIPVISNSNIDEFLQDSGDKIKGNVDKSEKMIISDFSKISNPGTHVFIDRMNDLVSIYNNTSEIVFDDKNIYLID